VSAGRVGTTVGVAREPRPYAARNASSNARKLSPYTSSIATSYRFPDLIARISSANRPGPSRSMRNLTMKYACP